LDHGVYEEVGDAIDDLIKHEFLQRCDQENPGFIRTDKPPQVAYSVFGNAAVKYELKRIAADREMLRGDITGEVVNPAYAEGPTLEQYRFLDRIDPWERPHKLTDADYINPSPELLAKVEARNERHRLAREKSAAKLAETKRRQRAFLVSINTDWVPALQKFLANRGISLPEYVRQQRREGETYIGRIARILDGIETKIQQEESAPGE
jgi:hypothetical protein